jgi:hypothetical protein
LVRESGHRCQVALEPALGGQAGKHLVEDVVVGGVEFAQLDCAGGEHHESSVLA